MADSRTQLLLVAAGLLVTGGLYALSVDKQESGPETLVVGAPVAVTSTTETRLETSTSTLPVVAAVPGSTDLQAQQPAAGYEVQPPDGFTATDEPSNGKLVGGVIGLRMYYNQATETKVIVAVHADADKEFMQWFEDFATHEGAVRAVETLPGAVSTWELTPDERSDPAWRMLVLEAGDGSFISINGWQTDGFKILYEFATRIVDAPGSLVPLETRDQGKLEG